LLARWYGGGAAGLVFPPWTSFGPILVFCSWALLSVQLVAEFRLQAEAAGFFCVALSAAIFGKVVWGPPGAAAASGNPIFRNSWAWIHLPSGVFAYSWFLLAAIFAAFALVRAGMRSDRFLCVLASLSLFALCARFSAPLGSGGEAASVWAMLAMGGFSIFLLASAASLWLESLDQRLHRERMLRQPQMAKRLGASPKERVLFKRVLLLLFAASTLVAFAAFRMKTGLSPYFSIAFAYLLLLDCIFLFFSVRREAIEERLPERESFARWSFQCALYAFPLLTIHLVSGSVWAYDAWGSSWSWQPQQGWVLISWFYLAWVLHLEHGKVSTAVVTCAGVLFMGVAIGVSGAHGFWPLSP